MTSQEMAKLVYRYVGVHGGYLGDFSYASHETFYPLYCDLDINPSEYGDSTKRRFEAILASLSPLDQAKVIRGTIGFCPVGERGAPGSRTEDVRDELLKIAARLEGVQVSTTVQVVTRDSVLRAIADAEVLLKTSGAGAVSAVDRIHTVLHGYLLSVCDNEAIAYQPNPTMTALLKLLRQHHPKFRNSGPRAADVDRVLNCCGTILDAMNPVRNLASVAHPNPSLLDEPEAYLVVNVARSVLAYLDAKVA